jgi:hypothetical protein
VDPDDDAPADLLRVRLLEVPVQVWGHAQEHSEELQREFALMGMGDPTGVPVRLLELVRHLRARYGQASSPQEQQLQAALEQGVETLDVEYLLPPRRPRPARPSVPCSTRPTTTAAPGPPAHAGDARRPRGVPPLVPRRVRPPGATASRRPPGPRTADAVARLRR